MALNGNPADSGTVATRQPDWTDAFDRVGIEIYNAAIQQMGTAYAALLKLGTPQRVLPGNGKASWGMESVWFDGRLVYMLIGLREMDSAVYRAAWDFLTGTSETVEYHDTNPIFPQDEYPAPGGFVLAIYVQI